MARILVIDDDDLVAKSLQMGLEEVGHTVAVAANGRKAMVALKEDTFELAITDMIMPEMEGIEMIGELTKSYPEIKIIAISGGGRIDPINYLKMAKSLGASRVFSKPLDLDELTDAIRELLA